MAGKKREGGRTTAAERMRKMRKLNKEDPGRKEKKLDTMYMFGSVDISVIVDFHGKIWFKGVDIARALNIEDPNESISRLVDKKYTKTYKDLVLQIPDQFCNIPRMHPSTTFVNERGMNIFVLRSRMPMAEEFTEWVLDVLESIRETGEFRIQNSDENPYKDLNDFLKREISRQEKEIERLTNESTLLSRRNVEKDRNLTHMMGQILSMRPNTVAPFTDLGKEEYFVVFKKCAKENENNFGYPYYALRVQLDSLQDRIRQVTKEYPQGRELKKWRVPNSVNFFNFVAEAISYLAREKDEKNWSTNSFKITNSASEAELIETIDRIWQLRYATVAAETNVDAAKFI